MVSGFTERDMLNALHIRYGERFGNGYRYAVAEHVKSDGAFAARRVADMIVIDAWKSGRYELHGHEVKVSRGDWLRELKDPSKAAEFIPYMNRWWVAVAGESIVKPGELPDGWGLLVLRDERIRVACQAARRDALPLTAGRLASLGRAIAKTATARAYREGYQAGREREAWLAEHAS